MDTTIKLTLKTGCTVETEADISKEDQIELTNKLMDGGSITIGCGNFDATYQANQIERIEFTEDKKTLNEKVGSPLVMEIHIKNGNIYDLATDNCILSTNDIMWNENVIATLKYGISQIFEKNGTIKGSNATIQICDVETIILKDHEDNVLATVAR